MSQERTTLTVDEIFETLKRTSLPTVLVEGKDDIIFYRAIEKDLKEFGVDMLPAGNKGAVLGVRDKLIRNPVSAPIIFVVDKDIWVYNFSEEAEDFPDVIKTDGYSIENDLFADGELLEFLDEEEKVSFNNDLSSFLRWYALAVNRAAAGRESSFRTHPGKVLDDEEFYRQQTALDEEEVYPERLLEEIYCEYGRMLRGKSLFALLMRQLSAPKRKIKFSSKQLMAVGAARKGHNYKKLRESLRSALEEKLNA